jgi:mRNA interferase RelE/StbE
LAWTIEIDSFAQKQLRKLDRPVQKRLLDWLDERIEGCKNPRHFGEPLRGDLNGLWRYRVGDYRIICEMQEQKLIVLALAIGHRREIYTRQK